MAKTATSKTASPQTKKPTVRRIKDHDIFVRGILGINEFVLKLLLHYIPKAIQPYVDFSTLKILNDKQISNKLKYVEADSIHECAMNLDKFPQNILEKDKLPIFRFCFLWEHKSSKPDEPIEFQVEPYRYGIIRADLKNQQTPSVVIPILLYHGADKWDKKTLYEKVKPYLPPEVLEYVPYPKYIVIDLQAMSEADIEQLTDLEELRAVFVALKYGHDKDFFRHDVKKVLKFVQDLSSAYLFQKFFKMLSEYMQRRSQIEKEEFDNILEQNLDETMGTRKIFKTTYEIAEERGEARAKRNIAAHLIKTTTDSDAEIAKIVGLEEASVKAIRQELKEAQLSAS
jgi:Putative transposase, YhgA-like